MSILEQYSKGTITGASGPSVRRRREIEDNNSKFDRENAGAFGTTYADSLLQAQRTGRTIIEQASLASQPTQPRYITKVFEQINSRTNTLVNKALSNPYGPNKFATDIIPYTERQFAIANASLGQASLIPSVLQQALQSKPILTPINPNIGTLAGPPSETDGRYDITIGYGFVLYNNLTNGGYA